MQNACEIDSKTNGIFGHDSGYDAADLVLIPANWDTTASYRKGCADSPEKIKDASTQLDLFNPNFYESVQKCGITMLEPNKKINTLNKTHSPKASTLIQKQESGIALTKTDIKTQESINKASETVNQLIYDQAETCIKDNKIVGLIGGDHSCSYGIISALIDYVPNFGILQIDAHMDLRPSYAGFKWSHASIMHHCLEHNDISRLIQVGIRDYCEDEYHKEKNSKGRIKTFSNETINDDLYKGKTWDSICKKISHNCPDNIYISCDIDGLQPQYCPETGTPVPGGLDMDQVTYLFKHLVKSNKTIIGFDCVEVNGAANSIDIISGAHLLYQLCGYTLKSQDED